MARKKNRQEKATVSDARDELLWLETYFIAFSSERRPTLAQVEDALASANPHLKLDNLEADDDGLFASVLVQSPEDHAAVEVSYETGETVIEQNLEWAKQLQKQLTPKQLQKLVAADARLDVAHFERVAAGGAKSGSRDSAAQRPAAPRVHDEEESAFDDDSFEDASFDDDVDEQAMMEDFDPTCLLTVVETLSTLTRGLAYDPASGEVL